ncbi:MAG: imidazole glycerol phosphate synthase subunit HisH [Desulfobacterium sp.]|nr:imidazole glycerol phosphate synthase subunit HisH [Desulfobacterium sp.]
MITIIDYGMGNVGSIKNMLERIGEPAIITNDIGEIREAVKIILPGVGAFDNAMTQINDSGLRSILDHKALNEKIPILGICLGMQLLTRGSEEGKELGLNWIAASSIKFPDSNRFKVPHMGWNIVHKSTRNALTKGFEGETRFYFVHSYYVQVDDDKNSILKTEYGLQFDSAIAQDNIYGVQFHPEKSHRFGMRVLTNFAEL